MLIKVFIKYEGAQRVMFGCKNTHESIISTRVHSSLPASKYLPKSSLHFSPAVLMASLGSDLYYTGLEHHSPPHKFIHTPDLGSAQFAQVILTPKARQRQSGGPSARKAARPQAQGWSSLHSTPRCFLANELLHVGS